MLFRHLKSLNPRGVLRLSLAASGLAIVDPVPHTLRQRDHRYIRPPGNELDQALVVRLQRAVHSIKDITYLPSQAPEMAAYASVGYLIS